MIARYDPAFPHNPHQPETFTMSSAQQHIIALAGGGFSMEPQNLALDRYILDQANTARPAVCFLPTASGDASQYIVNFFAAYTQFDCRPSYIPLFSRTPDLHSLLLNQDVIFVGGGNTKSMLAVWQHGACPPFCARRLASRRRPSRRQRRRPSAGSSKASPTPAQTRWRARRPRLPGRQLLPALRQ